MIGMTHERGTTASYDLALYLAAQNARRERRGAEASWLTRYSSKLRFTLDLVLELRAARGDASWLSPPENVPRATRRSLRA